MIWSRRRSRQVLATIQVARTLVGVAVMPPGMRAIFIDALGKRNEQMATILGILERTQVQTKVRRVLDEIEAEMEALGRGRQN